MDVQMLKDAAIRLARVALTFGLVMAVQFYLNNQSLPALDLGHGIIDAFMVGVIHALTEYLRTWAGTQEVPATKKAGRATAGALRARYKTNWDYLPI